MMKFDYSNIKLYYDEFTECYYSDAVINGKVFRGLGKTMKSAIEHMILDFKYWRDIR